jgi:glycosyltransferase involved in cell wall biosynthesis
MAADLPLVSVILTTRDRPRLLPVALACFEHQTYANRELIVVDDGASYPANLPATEASSIMHIRLASGTPLGIKLNHGVDAARGSLCMKMDDDDWYGPDYLQSSVSALLASRRYVCVPAVVFHLGFLFFDLRTWRIHESAGYNAPGATLLFAKDDWRRRPFRPLPTDEDVWFYRDQIKAGAMPLPIDSKETFVAIRHRGHAGTFGHTWTHQLDGVTLEQYLEERPEYPRRPDELFPEWAVSIYRSIHAELTATSAPDVLAPSP